MIAETLKRSPTKVSDKFKYLKAKYTECKDARGPRNSGGEAPNSLWYYDLMDEIFSRDHNITPPHIASTRRAANNIPKTGSSTESRKNSFQSFKVPNE